jgi:hypothetical protein
MVLRQELMDVYREVQSQIDEVTEEARGMAISPRKLRDKNGTLVMIPLLAARVQILHSLVMLNKKES